MGTWGLASAKPPEARTRQLDNMRNAYAEHFQYLEQSGPMTIRGREVQGIGLPAEVLEKVYRANARRWYPGL